MRGLALLSAACGNSAMWTAKMSISNTGLPMAGWSACLDLQSSWSDFRQMIMVAVTPAAVAVRALTQTIPIVCPLLANPIGFGLIASESRPGGNVTGVLFRTEGLAGKQVELALQMIPDLVKIGFVVNVASETIIDRQELERECQKLNIKLVPAEVQDT